MDSDEQDKIDTRKEKIKNWLKNPYKLALVGILIFAFAIRFYYFLLTTTQPLWWDEAVYGTLAKNIILGKWDGTLLILHETIIRPPLLPFLWSILLRLNIGEVGVRFLLELLPSVISVFFVYLIGKELYNKKVGLISSFFFSVLWIHLFYTARLLTSVPAMAFLFPSIYYFIKSQKTEFNAKYFGISIFLLSLSTLTRYPNGVFFLAYLLFLLITWKIDLSKNKKFWFAGIIGLLPLLIFFFFNYSIYGNIFPAFLGNDYVQSGAGSPKAPFAFHLLNFIPMYLKKSFLVLFFIGAAISLFELVVGYDIIRKKQNLKSHLLTLLLLITIYSFFIFYLRVAEDRWLFPSALPLAIFVGFGIERLYNFIKKYGKNIALILVLAILAFGAYQQVTHADSLIKNKKESFLQVRQGFEWIKFNTPEDSIISGNSIPPYATYYAERYYAEKDLVEPRNITELENADVDYFVLQAFTPIKNEEVAGYIQNNPDKWQPINAFFFDNEQTQPALIIYKNVQ
ncbi:MAG: glycosyltransferase family 39 protein [Nanoarchaeota archaeon]|nr:glycosyltransferase family 39 protein [Nanoarchaeota archaeon]